MGVVIDMPATIVQEANEYAERSGCSFRDLLCLSVQMYLAEQAKRRKAEVSAWTEKFNALLDRTESRNDEPYKFNRADAYNDALLLVSASESGCDEFITEDLNDGQIYCGMKAVNPFKELG